MGKGGVWEEGETTVEIPRESERGRDTQAGQVADGWQHVLQKEQGTGGPVCELGHGDNTS